MPDDLTPDHITRTDSTEERRTSSSAQMLPFDPADLVSMRVRPAQFARMCEVSKQAVCDWIKRGIVSLGPDGRLDPVVASRQVFERTDPARLRARVFKDLARDVPDLREKVRGLKSELGDAHAQVARLAADLHCAVSFRMHHDDVSDRLDSLLAGISAALPSLVRNVDDDALKDSLDRLAAKFFYGWSDDEISETFDDPK